MARQSRRTETEFRLDAEEVTLEANTEKVANWMAILLGSDNFESRDKFFESISNGVLLMDLIEHLFPKHTIKVQRKARPASFHARDNITKVLESLRNVGLAQNDMFVTDDLVDRKGDKLVIGTLLSLRELARTTGADVSAAELPPMERKDQEPGEAPGGAPTGTQGEASEQPGGAAATEHKAESAPRKRPGVERTQTIDEEPELESREEQIDELTEMVTDKDREINRLNVELTAALHELQQYKELFGEIKNIQPGIIAPQVSLAGDEGAELPDFIRAGDCMDLAEEEPEKVDPSIPLRDLPYYYKYGRKEAEKCLFKDHEQNPVGKYLIRPCNDKSEYVAGKPNPDLYVLTFVDKNYKCQHVKVFQVDGGFRKKLDHDKLCNTFKDFLQTYTPAVRFPVSQ